jgi:predicted RNA methylase
MTRTPPLTRAQQALPRIRRHVVGSMRSCVDRRRVPIGLKLGYITVCQQVLKALEVGSDDAPLTTEYGTLIAGGAAASSLGSVLQYRGVFEPVLSEFILRHVREGDVCVDAGANVGYFTLLLASAAGRGGKVVAIEAAPGNVRRLRENLGINEVSDRVRVVEAACAAEPMVTPDIVEHFTHPRLVVALEAKAPHVAETLRPFRDAGFHAYDLHNDYRWVFERAVPRITAASYDDFTSRKMADVLVSREPLDLP